MDTEQRPQPDSMPPLEGYGLPEIPVLPDLPEPEYLPPVPLARKRKRIRPELIMALIAAFLAVLLVAMVALCWPSITREREEPLQTVAQTTLPEGEEDPQAILEQKHLSQESQAAESPQEDTRPEETEETTEPTIPPDSNPYGRLDFQYQRHNYLYCLRTESYAGVDVSAYQKDINWKKVAASGIDFAMIRLGYRGYGKAGRLVEDDWAQKNLFEASREGLSIGAYFFSQALTFQEVEDEIQFMLEILGDYTLDMPIVLDWEIPTAEARTANMDAETLTELQLYFCERMEAMGYQPMVYFNWHQSENLLYLSELEEYPFWLALYQDRMTYPWKVEMWQFTCTGKVPGIQGDVDVNVYMPG